MFGLSLEKPSFILRIVCAKTCGFVIGLLGLGFMAIYMPNAPLLEKIGVVFWYATLGGILGIFGVMNYHPVLKISFPWWARGIFLGGWMNFLLVLFAHEQFSRWTAEFFGATSIWNSAWWCVVEGALMGLIIEYVATRVGGDGPDLTRELRAPYNVAESELAAVHTP